MDASRTLRRIAFFLISLLAASLPAVRPSLAQGQPGSPAADGAAALFEKQCYSCHNIGGGDKKGPDLQGLLQRRDRAWLLRYIPSPLALKNAGDPTAVQLFKQYAPEEMPDQMLSPDQINQILGLIEQLSGTKKTFIPQSGRLSRNVVPQDIPAGERLFTGQTKLAGGAPACISCHSVTGIGALGGGTLGPDLTQANLKYTDVELASILKMPAFPTMSKVFANRSLSDEEVVQIFAYLQSARTRAPDTARAATEYLIWGGCGVLALFGLMGLVWRGRLRGVRKPLVNR